MSAINTITSTANNPVVADSRAEKARTQLSGDFETFLKLLTTQLKNQDPVEPLDTHEFTSQLVQFATVEQAIATNENLESMLSSQKSSEISNAASYIGKFVEAKGDSARLQGGVAAFSYDLPSSAYQAEIIIKDAQGRIVYSGYGPTDAGKNDVLWDGTSNTNGSGSAMPEGTYHISVVAKDARMEKIEATTYTTGFISAVDIENGQAIYRIGDIKMSLEDIRSVRDPRDLISGGSGGDETELGADDSGATEDGGADETDSS